MEVSLVVVTLLNINVVSFLIIPDYLDPNPKVKSLANTLIPYSNSESSPFMPSNESRLPHSTFNLAEFFTPPLLQPFQSPLTSDNSCTSS